jgi:deaminated glutathione amidase
MQSHKTAKTMKAAVIQMNTGDDKPKNLSCAEYLIRYAAAKGATLVALPEMFSWRGPDKDIKKNSESVPGPTIARLSRIACSEKVHIVAGSIAERAPHRNKVFNTSVLIKKDGSIGACYRKIHLFEFQLKNGILLNENQLFIPGERVVCAQLPGVKLGLSICYDLRFPELYRTLTSSGSSVFSVPSAFTFETGMLHWEVLLRARAIENQVYILAPNQCGVNTAGSEDYGHSMIIGPRGEVLGVATRQEDIVIAEINIQYVRAVRKQLPALKHIRQDA